MSARCLVHKDMSPVRNHAHSPRHPLLDNMVVTIKMEDRPRPMPLVLRPVTLRPLTVKTDPAAFVDTPIWSAAPMTGHTLPQVLLPDSADEERISEIDQQALQNLRSFQSQPWNYSASFSSTPSSSPSSAGCYERRHTLASPTTPAHFGFDTPVSPSPPRFTRRRSAPFAGRRALPEPGMVIVVPQQLSRPSLPAQIAPGVEVWWPVQPNGEVKVHVGIMNRRGQAEKLTRCFPSNRLQGSGRSPSPPHTPFCGSVDAGQRLMPGAVLPVPGESGMPGGRRFSTGWSPVSPGSPRPRRGSHFDFPSQLIRKDCAVQQLSLLGAIITQTKRPIRGTEHILMPMPYPSAWADTIEYIHTGGEVYLSETVKSNLLHLGGRF